MTQSLKQNKSVLAKLLAGENFSVVHSGASRTAAFDVAKRVLYCPVYREMSPELYDLIMGHEVGHALFTPAEGWHNQVHSRGKAFKGFLNIIEDARIERMMQDKYPGLRRSFVMGYQELIDKNFFGDISQLTLFIDRINVHFKIGAFSLQTFSAEEQKIVNRIAAAQTWEEVVELAEIVWEMDKDALNKKREEPKLDIQQPGTNETENDGEPEYSDDAPEYTDSETSESSEDFEESEESDNGETADSSEETDESSNEDSAEEGSADTENGESANSAGSANEIEPESATDKAFRDNEKQLNADAGYHCRTGTMLVPDAYKHNLVVRAKRNMTAIRELSTRHGYDFAGKLALYRGQVSKILRKESAVVSQLVNEFEMRKNASQLANASVAKTGNLDCSRLHKYRTTEDIFSRTMRVEEGKNHGMIMLLDQSASMNGIYRKTVEQIIVLVDFCRKVGIPFSVLGYIAGGFSLHQYYGLKQVDCGHTAFHTTKGMVREYISSEMNTTELNNATATLLMLASEYVRGVCDTIEHRRETPLRSAVLYTASVVKEFQEKYNVEVMNTVILTDGAPTDSADSGLISIRYADGNAVGESSAHFRAKRSTFSDLHAAIDYLKKSTGTRVIGIYLPESESNVKSWCRSYGLARGIKGSAVVDTIRSRGFARIDNVNGFDSFYLTQIVSLYGRDVKVVLNPYDKVNARNLAAALGKAHVGSRGSRALLAAFADSIT